MASAEALTAFLRKHGKSRFSLRCMCSGYPYSFPFPLHPPLSHPAFVRSVPLYVHRLSSSRSLFPLSGWMSMSGPLFILSPAWKLSQTATPVYLRGGEAIFPRDLLHERLAPIISKSYRGLLNGGGWKVTVKEETIGVNERFLNLPNMISIGRMVSGPAIGWMIINEFYLYAFCGLAISGATDWLDGFVARKMNINSVMGSYLDPLADKVLIGCVAVAMVKKDLLNRMFSSR
ncbi:hypothetical protein HPP92_017034 [Vanilla planifolia]|uniref:Uncharacterized protein n=1 Tax=Vanilla planifolia TaxID=51239 RepID=A0A835QPV9_VANPL|nr:hypothetical protein HPP92_017034 [Vanilla planifolia]